MANNNWSVYYEDMGREHFISDITESQAMNIFRTVLKNFYNRELGTCGIMRREFGDMIVTRGRMTVLEYNSKNTEIYVRAAGKKEVFGTVLDWEDIFTTKFSKIHEKAYIR